MPSHRKNSPRSDAREELAPAVGIANGIALALSIWCVLGSAFVLTR